MVDEVNKRNDDRNMKREASGKSTDDLQDLSATHLHVHIVLFMVSVLWPGWQPTCSYKNAI